MNKAAFLDRDGVINRRAPEGDYITRWEDVHLLPGAADAIAALNRAGFLVIVVTNQRCVAKGLISTVTLEAMHQRMNQTLRQLGATIDAVYYCPHEKAPVCECRKPAPGMLLQAARDHQIDLAGSWMIGDSDIDIKAGRKAGCHTARVRPNDEIANENADLMAVSLSEIVRQVLAFSGASIHSRSAETLAYLRHDAAPRGKGTEFDSKG